MKLIDRSYFAQLYMKTLFFDFQRILKIQGTEQPRKTALQKQAHQANDRLNQTFENTRNSSIEQIF